MQAGLFVLVALVAIAAAVGSFVLKQRRRDDLNALAKRLGLSYSQDDPYDLTSYPFLLLGKGDGRGCENVLSGSFYGVAVKEADYWYFDRSTDSQGHTSKTYHRYSIVIADLALTMPHVSVSRENLLTMAADHMGLRDIEFESEGFNRAFNVKALDKEFAFKLIDARMEQFILDTEGAFAFESAGSSLLVSCHKRTPAELVPLFGAAKGFVDHIPRLVWNEYGTGEGLQAGTGNTA